jgi:hypothetical protein
VGKKCSIRRDYNPCACRSFPGSSDLYFKNSACAASNSGANVIPQTFGDKHAGSSIVARIDPVISNNDCANNRNPTVSLWMAVRGVEGAASLSFFTGPSAIEHAIDYAREGTRHRTGGIRLLGRNGEIITAMSHRTSPHFPSTRVGA